MKQFDGSRVLYFTATKVYNAGEGAYNLCKGSFFSNQNKGKQRTVDNLEEIYSSEDHHDDPEWNYPGIPR